jgi:hypothetical protein
MASWRDSASTAAQGDLDRLLNAVVPFAREQLVPGEVMVPFGASLDAGGQLAMLAVAAGVQAPSSADAVLDLLYADARGDAGLGRAFAFVADVRTGGDPALRIELEHREGVALVVMLSYTRGRLRRKVVLGPMVVRTAPPRVWAVS